MISDRVNRKMMLGLACVGWSLSTFTTGFANSYATVMLSRIGTGLF